MSGQVSTAGGRTIEWDREENYSGECPLCHAPHGLSVGPARPSGDYWGRVTCRKCDLNGSAWLRTVLYAVGAPASETGNLLMWPFPFIGHLLRPKDPRPPELCPSPAEVEARRQALHKDLDCAFQREYLHGKRMISRDVTRNERIGWDFEDDAFWIPVRRGTSKPRVIQLVRRKLEPPKDYKYPVLRGVPHAWYPRLPTGDRVMIVAGIFDVLTLLGLGIPAVASTSGASIPRPDKAGSPMMAELKRRNYRRIVLAYDVGEEDAAEASIRNLAALGRVKGVQEWRTADLGWPSKTDLNDVWMTPWGQRNLRLLVRDVLGLPVRPPRRVVRRRT